MEGTPEAVGRGPLGGLAGLAGEGSVHLSDWPDLAAVRGDDALVMAMDRVREVMTAGRGALRPFSAPV